MYKENIFRVLMLTMLMYLFVSPVLMIHAESESRPFRAIITADEPDIFTFEVKTTDQPLEFVALNIPYPLDFLNEIKFFFPFGALDEDIQIQFSLPAFAWIDDDLKRVQFFGDIISAVCINVSVNENIISPYNFGVPIELTITFNVDRLADLGLTPYDLTMEFVTPEGEFESEGIEDVTVDMEMKVLTGKVSHFSDIAIVPKKIITEVDEDDLPFGYYISQNLPDPSTPSIIIEYRIPQAGKVTLSIYNTSGQRVTVLKNEFQQAGNYTASWNANGLPIGMYFCIIRANGFTETRRLVLVK
ncbi:T9SS type A sorting domain-containing protein [Candidatus Latescibacterota bacterium]